MTMTLSRKQGQVVATETRQAEFDALFQQHWERLCRVLFNLLGDWSEAEDLALETFVQLFQRPPAQAGNLGGWLYRVATNLGLNTLRARRRRLRYEEQSYLPQNGSADSQDPAALVEQALERQQVQAALSAMKPRSAQILILRHSGLSYAEIAVALNVGVNSVGTLLVRAEKEFKKQYP
jgi:RNA polymerase sigma-70 factor (ECF subfamily)